jgi:type I restriction enzyme, S subunit
LSNDITEALHRVHALRQSILKDAFSGRLVAQVPADEPTEVLLKRIRAERQDGPASKRRNSKNGKKEAA